MRETPKRLHPLSLLSVAARAGIAPRGVTSSPHGLPSLSGPISNTASLFPVPIPITGVEIDI